LQISQRAVGVVEEPQTCELQRDGIRVSKHNRLGAPGEGARRRDAETFRAELAPTMTRTLS
jgi:hypothetical protein